MTEPQPELHPALITTQGLQALLDKPQLRLFDTTVHLRGKPGGGYEIANGRDDYQAAHIPGAGFIDVWQELSDPDHALRFMLPPEPLFVERMGGYGVGPDSRVVLYNAGPTWWATRVWFMLREYGFDAVQVLDGGLDKWKREGLALNNAPCTYPPARFRAGTRRRVFVDKSAVLQAVIQHDRHVVNALSPAVFSGRVVGYGRPGRIAGSVNVPAADLLDPSTQAFLPESELRQRLGAQGLLDGRGVIAYCGGGISATTDAFALHLLGEESVQIYDASMNEWGPDPSLPMERDP